MEALIILRCLWFVTLDWYLINVRWVGMIRDGNGLLIYSPNYTYTYTYIRTPLNAI